MSSLSERHLYRVLELPKHLQTTAIALLKLGCATASEVAEITLKARAVESSYLNQLAVMRVARKERRGRKACFTVNLEGFCW
jgi:hypothetical protein